jgi:hypothetical protein
LEIAILKPVDNTFLKRGNQVIYSPNFHHALDLPSWDKPQLHGSKDSEEAVSSVNQSK